MPRNKLTRRQSQILDFIRQSMETQGYPPTRTEIAKHFGFRSPNAAECHLRALQQKGVLVLQSGLSRGIILETPAAGPNDLPLVGQVAAGSPILAEENIESYHPLPPALFPGKPDYLLRVRGDSMRDAGILDGDLIAVRRQREARKGQIIVARVDDEVTVKRYMKVRHTVHLLPENPDYQPIQVNLAREPFSIEGICVGVIRSLVSQH